MEPPPPSSNPALASLLARERQVLRDIAAGRPLRDVLTELLLAVEADSGHGMKTSVLFVDEEAQHLLHGVAPSLPDAYNAVVDGIAIGEGVGSCGTAVFRHEPVFVSDIANDPLWAAFRELALSFDLRACWSTPILAADGRMLGTFAIYYDTPRTPAPGDLDLITFITQTAALAIERHLSDTQLRDSNAKLVALNADLERRVMERSQALGVTWQLNPDLLSIIDFNGRFDAVNPAWTKMLGWTQAELVGAPYTDFVHPDDLEKSYAAFAEVLRGNPVLMFENRYRKKDGDYALLSWVAVPQDGKLYSSTRDITAQREQAGSLTRAEDALRQSQKMEAVGQLTGGIAHDFNNMLAVVMGSLDLLDRRIGPEDPRSKRFVHAAMDGAKRAANLTQRLLAFSRQQPLKPENLDINRLVSGMSDLLRHSLGVGIQMETILAGGLWKTHVDPNQLENIILNLAVNARDAMPDGGRLTIETQNAHLDSRYVQAELGVPAGQYVMIAINDTGSGMSSDVIAKAFDPFFTTKEVGKGTGLGLSQVYGFVKQSGGHIRIYSEVGDGTTIKLYLPRTEAGDGPRTVQDPAGEALRGEGREWVLVVDDEDAVRQFSTDALEELGYSVVSAASASEALDILRHRDDIALLFTDIVMPEVNGRKLADQAQLIRPGLKVLYTTGYTRNAVVHNGVVDKGVELIGKPFTVDDLAVRVREILESATVA